MLMSSPSAHACATQDASVWLQFVMWMQQGRICILGKIEFFIDNENAGKNAQVKLYFMPELKVILNLWKK